MKVLLDIDGVLADLVGGACKLHNKPNPYDNHDNHGTYDIQKLMGIPAREFWGAMTRNFWANLEPTPYMTDIVNLLVKAYGGENICLLTSPILTDGCIDGKMEWIRKHLPAFKRQYLIGPAKEFCAHEGSLLIDDSETNVNKFRAAGGSAFLVPGPWNLGHCTDPIKTLENYLRRVHARY